MTKFKNIKKISSDLVSDYFIWKANKENKPITNKKLQKLVYYSQAWSLVFSDKPLFNDKIEAWVHGPAVRSLYNKYKKFGFEPIKKEVGDGDIKKIDGTTREFLDEVWKVYGKHDALYLEFLTHNEKPWQEAREGLSLCESSNNEISLQTMKEYYAGLLEK